MDNSTWAIVAILITVLVVASYFLWQQSKLAAIRRKADDEFEDQIYQIASLDLGFQATIGRLLRITARWAGADLVCLIVRPKGSEKATMSSLMSGRLTKNLVSFADADFSTLVKFFTMQRSPVAERAKLPSRDAEIGKMLAGYGVNYLMSLRAGGQTIGFLGLTDSDGEISKYKIAEIEAALNGVAVALSVAWSHDSLIELNKTLEQRVQDATKEVERSNEQLRKFDKIKDEFVAMVSHQLRTPLTTIKGYLSLTLEGDVGQITPDQQRVLGEAFRASETMSHMINDFLSLSRIQAGRFRLLKSPRNLVDLITSEVESMREIARLYDLKIELDCQERLPAVINLDRDKIRQAIGNLLDNAIYYSDKRSVIGVTIKQVSRSIEVTVRDRGIGVPPKERAELFDKFFRASNGRKRRPDGTGIGLYLVQEIISRHNGEVFYQPSIDKGSVFGFRLPIDRNLNPGIHIEQQN
ncbi:MAG: sensor histidine kinase [Candidatus Nanosyncoccaceae bacterium]|jgi:signal transduction histidine kinase